MPVCGFRTLVWTCSARFSISSFWLPASLSCDCLTPARIQASGFIFRTGLATLASPFSGSGFRLGACAIACLQPAFRFRSACFRFWIGPASLASQTFVRLPCCPAQIPVPGFRFETPIWTRSAQQGPGSKAKLVMTFVQGHGSALCFFTGFE